MRTTVDGVQITLTKTQIKHIEKIKAERRKNLKTFEAVLLRFGFKRFMDTRSPDDMCYTHDKGWWAEIYDNDYVWMTGAGLKDIGSFPGGYNYHSPESLIKELEAKS